MDITLGPLYPTKEYIESKVSQEELMSTYYGVPVKKGLFLAKHRKDSHKTVSYYMSRNGRLLVKDFASNYCGDWVYVLMNKENCSFSHALLIAANDFGLLKSPSIKKTNKIIQPEEKISEKQPAIIKIEIRPFQKYELDWWMSYGITEKTLKKFNVFSCKNVFLNGNLFSLESPNQYIFGYYGGIRNNIETWRIYFPKRRGSSFKFISNWTATQIQGAQQLPKDGGDLLVITKSMKDLLALYEYGITAIAPNSENLFVTERQLEKLKTKFKKIIVVYDNDLAGVKGLNKIKKEHPELKYAFIPRHYGAKDFSDFRKKYGEEKTRKFIEEARNFYFPENKEKEI